MQAGVSVTLEVFPRMWHDFVMYSEGCGGESPQPLKEASVAIAHVAEFFQACEEEGTPPTASISSGEAGAGIAEDDDNDDEGDESDDEEEHVAYEEADAEAA